MALLQQDTPFRVLSDEELDAWRAIPPAVASDCMNRTQVMSAAIKPIREGQSLCGQARTVTTMVGDCGPICALISAARPGEIVMVDAGGVEDTAVWGGVMTEEAVHRRLGGAVIDGAVRDVADMRKAGFAMFCRSVVPRGPHHGFGGTVDGLVSVAGVPVRSGDIVLGNDDGVVVVPLEQADAVLAAAQAHLLKEEGWVRDIRRGVPIPTIFEFPSVK
ncbi:RraA family protein [Azospirillum rugosum]|uniref:Putative 4-hydroxy-4-methyl-2-oxoglutarate aldolase n=1 Tax=Azospirillum rugosum TaxID=416170 RepID=A0ABS4SX05_9PROT|nr:RraA family protein [Azospirillum rugosum]MBP2296794.1 regulator of RNase E activity RraA [Azospirillum rugosum]MDQ0530397.1 regulator of RNase E activity RraA [Azospirillum rugosum]